MGVHDRVWTDVRFRLFLVLLGLFSMRDVVSLGQELAEPPPPRSASPSHSDDPEGILNLDLDQLGKVDVIAPAMSSEVTSVSKQESTVGHSAAAVYVINQEMIRRSGANSIPDLLRLVPGLDVAQIDGRSWAISSRGFNSQCADKLLVLIDGRSVYTPVFSGVYWDAEDVLLEDIERIEVIRGPGGTLWGANAVNGVINIITKKAKDTQGALVTYGGGTEDRGLGGARYGGKVGDDLHWRIYGKHFERDAGFSPVAEYDASRQGRAGFRMDWEPDHSNFLTVQGDYYVAEGGMCNDMALPVPPYQSWVRGNDHLAGGNLLARWTHVIDDQSDWQLQAYFDRADREFPAAWDWNQSVSIGDVEFQHRFPLGQRHEVIWGAHYRQVSDTIESNGFNTNWNPPRRTTDLVGVFIQDEIVLVEDRLFFTVGSKFEQNDYTGFEYQPSGRLLVALDQKRSLWGAVSRAVRTPSRWEHDGMMITPPQPLPFPPFQVFPQPQGSRQFESEDLMAYELGYRAQPDPRFAYDIALFYNVYEGLASLRQGPPPYFDSYGNLMVPASVVNGARAQSYGLEISGQWTVSDCWRVSGSYSLLRLDYELDAGDWPMYSKLPENNPRNQVRLISSWDLGNHWQFDTVFRYVDSLPGGVVPDLAVPAYLTMDLRLAWLPSKHLEVAVVGRNLLDSHHLEYKESALSPLGTEVERSVFGKVTWRY